MASDGMLLLLPSSYLFIGFITVLHMSANDAPTSASELNGYAGPGVSESLGASPVLRGRM